MELFLVVLALFTAARLCLLVREGRKPKVSQQPPRLYLVRDDGSIRD